MGHHTASDIPNYWTYAENYALDDQYFETDESQEPLAHLLMVSAWSADCKTSNPMSCTGTDQPANRTVKRPKPFAWTDLTWLLHMDHVSWGYYLDGGAQSPSNRGGVPTIWNPLPGFTDVQQDGQQGNVQNLGTFMTQAKWVTCRRSPGWCPTRPTATSARPGQPGPGLRDQDHQRGHEEPGLEVQRDLPGLG